MASARSKLDSGGFAVFIMLSWNYMQIDAHACENACNYALCGCKLEQLYPHYINAYMFY